MKTPEADQQVTVEVEVKSIRSLGKIGGAIFYGLTDTAKAFAIHLEYKYLRDTSILHPGQVWRVSGEVERKSVPRGGYEWMEDQLYAAEAYMLKPSQRNLVNWMINSPEVKGVGRVKALKLDRTFGKELTGLLQCSDLEALSKVLTKDSARSLCDAFSKDGLAGTITWLDSVCLNLGVARKVMDFYGDECEQKITENPYRLISFNANWKAVDDFALTKIGVKPDADHRLCAAVEQALYMRSSSKGCTAAEGKSLTDVLSRVLLRDKELSKRALHVATEAGQVVAHDGLLASTGAWLIERSIATYVTALAANSESHSQTSLLDTEASASHLISAFEKDEGYALTQEQRTAVTVSSQNNISLILGGAGTGKTTVLVPPRRRKAALIPDAQRALNGRLLIVENDEMILDGLRSMCQQGGFSGEAYAQGNALLSTHQFPRYDCMVTDYHLDPHTGVGLINHVRAHSHVTLPAIVLTADTTITAERIAASITHGPSVAVYYKPLTRDALFEAIAVAMDQKSG